MKNTIPIMAVGAFVLMTAFSKKTSKNSASESKSDENPPENPPENDPEKQTWHVIFPQKENMYLACNEDQFFNEQTKKCEFFWIKGQTDQIVYEKFSEIITKNNLGTDQNKICIDIYVNGEAQQNKLAQDIIKKTIVECWKQIPLSELPPKATSPKWLKTIWERVTKLYYTKICNF